LSFSSAAVLFLHSVPTKGRGASKAAIEEVSSKAALAHEAKTAAENGFSVSPFRMRGRWRSYAAAASTTPGQAPGAASRTKRLYRSEAAQLSGDALIPGNTMQRAMSVRPSSFSTGQVAR
jgi:hypothetical protein